MFKEMFKEIDCKTLEEINYSDHFNNKYSNKYLNFLIYFDKLKIYFL